MLTQHEWKELNGWLGKINLAQFTGDDQHKSAHWHAKTYNHPFHKPCSCQPQIFIDWLGDIKKWVEGNKDKFEPQTDVEV
jgi:hypothetical protein